MIQKKVIKHKRNEVCRISKEKIDTTRDRYCILLDCEGKEVMGQGFYKLEVLRDLIKGNGEIIANNLRKRYEQVASGMLHKLKEITQTSQ